MTYQKFTRINNSVPKRRPSSLLDLAAIVTFATFTSLPVLFIAEDTLKLAHYGRGRFVCDQFGGPRAREELMSCDRKAVRRVSTAKTERGGQQTVVL